MRKNGLRAEYLKTMSQLATAGFGLVAALAWNDAIQSLINRFVAPGSSLRSKIFYALIVTGLAVLITYFLGKMTQKEKEKEHLEAERKN